MVDDPYNQKRVLTTAYNALHDPNAKNYFSKPSVQKQLLQQGLVTPNGEVVCSLGEFNQFRSYLNTTIYNEKLNSSLDAVVSLLTSFFFSLDIHEVYLGEQNFHLLPSLSGQTSQSFSRSNEEN